MSIVPEYRSAALGQAAVVTGTAFTLAGVLSASIANVMQGTRFARAQSMTVMIAWAMLFGALADGAYAWITTGPPVIETRFVYLAGVLHLGVIAGAVTFPLSFRFIRPFGQNDSTTWREK